MGVYKDRTVDGSDDTCLVLTPTPKCGQWIQRHFPIQKRHQGCSASHHNLERGDETSLVSFRMEFNKDLINENLVRQRNFQ